MKCPICKSHADNDTHVFELRCLEKDSNVLLDIYDVVFPPSTLLLANVVVFWLGIVVGEAFL